MLFKYKAIDDKGINKEGEIDAPNRDIAISGLQRRGLDVISIKEEGENKSIFQLSFFERVKPKDIVILSRQISTLFEAQVSALKAFTMLAANTATKRFCIWQTTWIANTPLLPRPGTRLFSRLLLLPPFLS